MSAWLGLGLLFGAGGDGELVIVGGGGRER